MVVVLGWDVENDDVTVAVGFTRDDIDIVGDFLALVDGAVMISMTIWRKRMRGRAKKTMKKRKTKNEEVIEREEGKRKGGMILGDIVPWCMV